MSDSSPISWSPAPLSEQSIAVRFVRHRDCLEAVMHGFVNAVACAAALHEIAVEVRRTHAERLLIDTGPVIGQLTKSEHATVGEQVAALFPGIRVAAIAPVGRPVGEIAPAARSKGADYLGFGTRAEALAWLLAD